MWAPTRFVIRVIEVERAAELNPKIIRLKEEFDAERERGLRMLAEFDN